jgi:hypothetical protein
MNKKLFFIGILLSLFSIGEADVIEKISNITINWTAQKITIQAGIETPNYLMGKGYQEEIREYRTKIKEKIIHELLNGINQIVFDENRQVGDIFSVFPEKETKLISLLMRSNLKDFRYYNKKVYAEYELPLFGKDSLFEILVLPTIRQDYAKFVGFSEPKVYTGLLINVQKLDFKLSLSPTIISENGEIIHSYGNVKNGKPHIYYFETLRDAVHSGIFGDKIYYLFPKEVGGRNKTKIVISDYDVYRLLSTEENFRTFEEGKVGIITRE